MSPLSLCSSRKQGASGMTRRRGQQQETSTTTATRRIRCRRSYIFVCLVLAGVYAAYMGYLVVKWIATLNRSRKRKPEWTNRQHNSLRLKNSNDQYQQQQQQRISNFADSLITSAGRREPNGQPPQLMKEYLQQIMGNTTTTKKEKAYETGEGWQIIFPVDNATTTTGAAASHHYDEFTPKLDVIWSRSWYNAVPPPSSIPLSYYHHATQSTERQIPNATQYEYWNPETLCNNTSNSNDNQKMVFLWIRCFDVAAFAMFLQQHNTRFLDLKCNITLISSDGDNDTPPGYTGTSGTMLLNSPIIYRWYAQNVIEQQHPKLIAIPIGFDLHTAINGHGGNRPLGILNAMLQVRRPKSSPRPKNFLQQYDYKDGRIAGPVIPWEDRQKGILVDVGATSFCERRITVRGHLRRVVREQCGLQPMTYTYSKPRAWENYVTFPFATAPWGCGYDTHRLWEYLFFGTVPIILTSPLDHLYVESHAPVLIVDSWNQVCDLYRNDTLFQKMVERYHSSGWVHNAHQWLRPKLWIPRNQSKMVELCEQASPGCMQAYSVQHRMVIKQPPPPPPPHPSDAPVSLPNNARNDSDSRQAILRAN